MPPRSGRILLVDDDDALRYALARAMTEDGFEVLTAPDYREALRLLEGDGPIDLLVTDVVMPDRINGFALARMARMRRLELKVIYVTAYDLETDEAIGEILRKPVTEAQLLEAVRRALAG